MARSRVAGAGCARVAVSGGHALQSLFPSGAVVVAARTADGEFPLHPSEAEFIARAAPKRRRDFAAGRHCARRALAQLGIADFVLRAAPDRVPLWPAGVVGSISHTTDFCLAVVAETGIAAGIGVDAEVLGDVGEHLWPRICTPRERDWLESLDAARRPRAATLIFSVKEALYKCQYPLTREWLGFHDLEIEPPASVAAAGGIFVRATRPLMLASHAPPRLPCRYAVQERWLVAGATLAAPRPGPQ